MNTTAIVEEVAGLVAASEALRAENERLRRTMVNSEKFYNVPLPLPVVAMLHSVSPYIVREYIKLGLIEKHPSSTDAKILVRASEALVLDFTELKKQAKLQRL